MNSPLSRLDFEDMLEARRHDTFTLDIENLPKKFALQTYGNKRLLTKYTTGARKVLDMAWPEHRYNICPKEIKISLAYTRIQVNTRFRV